MRLFATRRLNL